jgi:hypothetical protein
MAKSSLSPSASEGSLAPVLAATLTLVAYYSLGFKYLDGFRLDLGSLNLPTPRYVAFVVLWTVFGGLSSALLAIGLSRAPRENIDGLMARWNAVSERRFLIWTCGAAVMIPVALRLVVLGGAPLSDDEGAYRFGAELLASGRLWVTSPPMKAFFDQNFMINDGRLYPAYFLGWPALLAIGVWIHAPGIVNPVLSALTVPPLFGVLRRFVSPGWARGGVLLFLSAPFLQIAAATGLSHTSCLMALTWCLFHFLRIRDDPAVWRRHAGFGFTAALAFCIRPLPAVAITLPLIVSWGVRARRLPSPSRLRAALSFLLPTAFLAALFLGSLWVQNGSPWRTGYVRYSEYLGENDFRFSTFSRHDLTAVPGFDFSEPGSALTRTTLGLFRLSADLFGWPVVLGLLALAWARKRSGPLCWMAGCDLLLMLFQRDWGIDTFGPMHAFELALPILALTVIGFAELDQRLTNRRSGPSRSRRWQRPLLAPGLFGALIMTAWLGFVPVRLEAVRQIAAHVNVALRAPEREGIHSAVIFAPLPFAPRCTSVPGHFVVFRPVNDPDLGNDILWVNHLNIPADRRLLETLPGRIGYVARWTSTCEVRLLPLAALAPGAVPPGRERP